MSKGRDDRLAGQWGQTTKGIKDTLWASQEKQCANCKIQFPLEDMHLDHIKPLKKGGEHEDSNLQVLCQACNLRKGAKDPRVFDRQEVVRRLGNHMTLRNRINRLEYVKAGTLISDPRNWRQHPKAQRDALQAVLDSVGYADAVIVRETLDGLMLIDGHLRAELDPEQVVPVLVTDLDETEAGQVLATLDPLAAMATPNLEALESLVKGLATQSTDAMADLMARMHKIDLTPPGETDPDETPDIPAEPVSQRGDVWLLGRHRLMCGDSSDADDVGKLLDGAEPRLMVTDPPYGVNYDADWRNNLGPGFLANPSNSGITYALSDGPVFNDEIVDWTKAYRISPSSVAYVWAASLNFDVPNQLIRQGYDVRTQLIWRKQQGVFSRGHYHWQHELCWYAVRKGAKARWIGDRKQTTIWDIGVTPAKVDGKNISFREETAVGINHSTIKPVECMERPIRNHEGDVYDPFVGSGTAIIAAERQGRACFAMEIAPGYVDAAVQRWEKYTGQTATRQAQVAQ